MAALAGVADAISRLIWMGTGLGSCLAAFQLITAIATSNGSPQQAAGAAIAIAYAVIPYVFARTFDEVFRPLPDTSSAAPAPATSSNESDARAADPVEAETSVERQPLLSRSVKRLVVIGVAIVAVLITAGFLVDWWNHPEAYW